LNGYNTYEVEVNGEINGKAAVIYQFVIVKERKAIVAQGRITTDFEETIRNFKAFARAIRFK
jgi:hypothetical protein